MFKGLNNISKVTQLEELELEIDELLLQPKSIILKHIPLQCTVLPLFNMCFSSLRSKTILCFYSKC